jgi:hypothetical protein
MAFLKISQSGGFGCSSRWGGTSIEVEAKEAIKFWKKEDKVGVILEVYVLQLR